jgi:hypothetical protein
MEILSFIEEFEELDIEDWLQIGDNEGKAMQDLIVPLFIPRCFLVELEVRDRSSFLRRVDLTVSVFIFSFPELIEHTLQLILQRF